MNNKAQVKDLGMFIGLFITILVGLILLVPTAQQIGSTTDTVTLANTTMTSNANATAWELTGYKSITDVVIYNATGNFLLAASNYTVANNVVSDGAEVATITPGVASAVYLSDWGLSGTAQPDTYISNSGGRAIAGIIILLFALAIAIIALVPSARAKFS